MPTPLLSAGPDAPQQDHRDRIIASLERENADLREELRLAREEAARAVNQNARAVAELRRILNPLHQALRAVFGEIDAISPVAQESPTAAPQNSRHSEVWDSWKKRLGGSVAKVIDALMTHGELDTGQLVIITGLDRRTISNTCIYKLNQAQLINKNAGRFSLKEI